MVTSPGVPRLLLSLDAGELERAATDQRYPKWSTMCLLRLHAFPVLNACHVLPVQPPPALHAAIRALTTALGIEQLTLRSDGGIESTRYYRGGNTFAGRDLEQRAAALLAAGRSVLLLEPTNRFTNRLAVLLRLDRPPGPAGRGGEFIIEALGPGYDVADLTRGGIAAQVTITIAGIDWARYEEPWWRDLQIARDLDPASETARRRQRLERLATQVLADTGELPAGGQSGADAAEHWLRGRGYLDLFTSNDPTMTVIGNAKSWFEDAFVLAQAQPNRGWQCLATAISDIGGGRTVFWDLIDGGRKYGVPGQHASAVLKADLAARRAA